MAKKSYPLFLFFLVLTAFTLPVKAQQPAWTIDLLNKQKKPTQFENRKLGSEKMAEKKFTPVRRFFQNTYTHYNYYYNANNKINAVIEKAKYAQNDNFSRLLPFYSYSLDNTATQTVELDSVILKVTAGILLHDLRNDWIDNMYLLMGKAYFLRKDFDSAAATFQFINYNLYPRKRKYDDDDKIIGTNYEAANNTISIANKEKQNILQKIASLPPSRNDALLWLARTFIEQGEMGASAGLLKTLQNDPNLPKRLQNDLDELNAYWFYKKGLYDSASAYLEKGLSASDSKQDKSRSEFLLAQMYEINQQYDKAGVYYDKAAMHTTNLLMDIYANLNKAKMLKSNDVKDLDKGIDNLLHMAKRDKFEAYRDIIYFSAGELYLQKADTVNAVANYNKSLHYNESNTTYHNKAFLRLADLAFNQKKFKQAFASYDSLQTSDTSLTELADQIKARRNALSDIVEKINIIDREDSLQKIASMPPGDRDLFLKKLSRKLRKQHGLKEEDNNGGVIIGFDNPNAKPVDLFTNSDSKGEWYFYNTSMKAKGLNEFKARWGTRSNVDNWRRKSAIDGISNLQDISVINPDGLSPDDITPADNTSKKTTTAVSATPAQEDFSYDGLMANIPLTPEKMQASNGKLAVALFDLAKLYQNSLEDYPIAITSYKESLQRFPDSLYNGEIYLGLYYCYTKLGEQQQAAYYKNLLTDKFASSHSAQLLTNPTAALPMEKNEEATNRYQHIYNLFLEGNFADALSEKKKADSLFGKNYWSPQLLYIEAVYHIKQREDSIAKAILKNLSDLYPRSPLKPKALTMIDVLGRRTEIEKYLTELQVTRDTANNAVPLTLSGKPVQAPLSTQPQKDSSSVASSAGQKLVTPAAITNPSKTDGNFTFNVTSPQLVLMVLNKIDPTYINEAQNALSRFNSENYREQSITISKEVLDKDNVLLIFASFADAEAAIAYCNKMKRAAPSEISWLPTDKYSFIIIENENLEKIKISKDLNGYKTALIKQYSGRF